MISQSTCYLESNCLQTSILNHPNLTFLRVIVIYFSKNYLKKSFILVFRRPKSAKQSISL